MKTAMETGSSPSAELFTQTGSAWYCLRTQMKREHIAAAHLRQIPSVEVFHPQLRLWRPGTRGPKRAIESLFPNYLFARFPLEAMLEKVSYTAAVKSVLRFGGTPPEIPDNLIEELKRDVAVLNDKELTDVLSAGQEVEVACGAFAGTKAMLVSVLPGKQRVQILLEVLGRAVPAEFNLDQVLFDRRNAVQIALQQIA